MKGSLRLGESSAHGRSLGSLSSCGLIRGGEDSNLGGDHDDEDCSYADQVRVGGSVGCIGVPAPAR